MSDSPLTNQPCNVAPIHQPEPVPDSHYSFAIPRAVRVVWVARVIYVVSEGDPLLDIVPDRQYMLGDRDCEEAGQLAQWLRAEGISGLQQKCKEEDIRPKEAREFQYARAGFVIRANPQSSYGYLYIVAHRDLPLDPPSNDSSSESDSQPDC